MMLLINYFYVCWLLVPFILTNCCCFQVIAVAKSSDLVLMVLDASKVSSSVALPLFYL